MKNFVKNEDGTVADKKHNLIWSATLGEDLTLAEAQEKVVALGEGWRLPTLDELQLIVDRTKCRPAANTELFTDMKADWYWTSSPCAWNGAAYWVVNFDGGSVIDGHQKYFACVRAVRDSRLGENEHNESKAQFEQLKRVHEAAMEAWAKQTKDLHFFLEQSIIIEHKQDHEKMRRLRKEYGYDF